jgi:hypothetical protein
MESHMPIPSKDALTRAVDTAIEDGRFDDYVRHFLYSMFDLIPGPLYGPFDLVTDIQGYKDAIESHAETLAENDQAEKRDPEEREEDEHATFPGCA